MILQLGTELYYQEEDDVPEFVFHGSDDTLWKHVGNRNEREVYTEIEFTNTLDLDEIE